MQYNKPNPDENEKSVWHIFVFLFQRSQYANTMFDLKKTKCPKCGLALAFFVLSSKSIRTDVWFDRQFWFERPFKKCIVFKRQF